MKLSTKEAETMKAVLMEGFGGLEVLKFGEAQRPVPKENEVLVRVHASSINRPDLVQRAGKYPPPPGDSEILGLEVAGTVEELGPGVTGWSVGDRVMSLVGGGGGLQDGETALLHGGGGGVNTAAIQLCKALAPKSKLIVTASPEKMERVKELGADLVINFKETPDFTENIKEFTAKKGVDVILDHVGAKYLAPNMNSLGYKGRLVVIGVISGIKAELNLALMMVKRQQIIGSVLRSRPVPEKGEIVAEFVRRALPKFADRTIVPIIEKVFPIEQVADAHGMMEADQHFGKIVLKVGA
jgi:NADPH2:quinone reductase